jgi:hypothetical protein
MERVHGPINRPPAARWLRSQGSQGRPRLSVQVMSSSMATRGGHAVGRRALRIDDAELKIGAGLGQTAAELVSRVVNDRLTSSPHEAAT